MRRRAALVTLFALALSILPGVGTAAIPKGPAAKPPSAAPSITTTVPPPGIAAASGILITGDGAVLWEKNAGARRAIASTTKIMTALVAIEQADPSEVVTASARAEAVGATDSLVTELELTAGERLTVEQLLYGLLLPSGSDAAVALAEHIGGSIEGFARMMNDRAQTLGALDTNFANPDGLDDPRAYSTAADLALMARAALSNDLFKKIVSTRQHQIPWAGRPAPRDLVNRNELLGAFSGATGIKTGNTRNAGRSLVASATRGGEDRISVILGSADPFGESARILDFGFKGFARFVITRANEQWGQITYGDGTTYSLVSTREATVLLGASSPQPRARYRPAGSVLVVDVPGGLTVPLKVRCGKSRCEPPTKSSGGVLAGAFTLFGPLLSVFR